MKNPSHLSNYKIVILKLLSAYNYTKPLMHRGKLSSSLKRLQVPSYSPCREPSTEDTNFVDTKQMWKQSEDCAIEAVGLQGDRHSTAAVGQLGSLRPLGSWALPWHRAPKFHHVKLDSNSDEIDSSNLFSIKSYINLTLKKKTKQKKTVKTPKCLWERFSFLKG